VPWDSGAVGTLMVPDDGGVTASHVIWLYYRYYNGQASIVRLAANGHVLGLTQTPFQQSAVVALDADDILYVCGVSFSGEALGPQCAAYGYESHEPLWHFVSEGMRGSVFEGAALIPGRLYAAYNDLTENGLQGGVLYAIGDVQP
jgi:hypothetical protein